MHPGGAEIASEAAGRGILLGTISFWAGVDVPCDHGAVLVLDGRIVRKSYGRYFLDSLPPARVVKGPWRVVKEELLGFYRERMERRRAE